MSVIFRNPVCKDDSGLFCKIDDKDNVYKEEFKGCVIELREWNDRDDSDFYAVCWKEDEGCLVRIYYDTTRWASNGNYAFVDASPEVIEKAKAFLKKKERSLKAKEIWDLRQKLAGVAKEVGLNRRQVEKLYKALYADDFWNVVYLLKTHHKNSFRSVFRQALAVQVMNWIKDPAPKFESPLSWRQLNCIQTFEQRMGWNRQPSCNNTRAPKGYYV